LHDLDDAQLQELVQFIQAQLPDGDEIVEQDRWTIWFAKKGE
jgi:hypothetical protein